MVCTVLSPDDGLSQRVPLLGLDEDISSLDAAGSGPYGLRTNPEYTLNREWVLKRPAVCKAGGASYEESVAALFLLKETEGPGRTRVPTTQ